MTSGYAVTAEREDGPTAVFATLEDALAWGTARFGPGAFHIEEVLTRAPSVPGVRAQAVPV